MEKKKLLPRLAELYLAFFRTGIFTFGGGLAMMPMLQKELIEKTGRVVTIADPVFRLWMLRENR